MKFKIDKSVLNQGIYIAQKAVSNRTPDPLLEGIYMKCEEGKITLFSTDNVMSIITQMDGEIEEDGEIVVGSRLFGDIVRRLPDSKVSISVDKNVMNIKCEKSNFNLTVNNTNNFPEMPSISGSQSFKLSCEDLKQAVRQTGFAVSLDEVRKTFTGILMDMRDDHVNFVALDGFRMALKTVHKEVGVVDKAIIPQRTLTELARILGDEGDVSITTSLNAILFEYENTKLYSTLFAGEFFRYEELVRDSHNLVVKVNRQNLQNSIERASLLAKEDRANLVKLEIENGYIMVSSNSELGDVKDEVFCEMDGRDIKIAFNSKYLVEGLKIMDEEEINLNFTDSVNPLIIRPVDKDDYLYLVLPVRLAG